MMDMFLLGLAAFFAGFVDSIVGGGGLVQVPALFSFFQARHLRPYWERTSLPEYGERQ